MRNCIRNLFCPKSLSKGDFGKLFLLVGKDVVSQDKV